MQLLISLKKYDKALRAAIKKDGRKNRYEENDSSCFLTNFAIDLIPDLAKASKNNGGKICGFDIKVIINQSKNLVSNNSEELNSISNSNKFKARLKNIRVVALKKIEAFKAAHTAY